MAEIPTPAFAVPYAAPDLVNMRGSCIVETLGRTEAGEDDG